MEHMIVYLREVIPQYNALKKLGVSTVFLLVVGGLGNSYFAVEAKRAETMPEVLRAEGDKAIRMAQAEVIRSKADKTRSEPTRQPPEHDKKTSLDVHPGS